jgi:DNA-binding IclR family transcriptional regulator
MQVLHEELGETVNLSVRHEDEVVISSAPPTPTP